MYLVDTGLFLMYFFLGLLFRIPLMFLHKYLTIATVGQLAKLYYDRFYSKLQH